MSSTIDVLKQLIQLEEKRASLTQELSALDTQLATLTRGLVGGRSEVSAPAAAPARRGRPPKSASAAPAKAAKPAAAPAKSAKPAAAPARPAAAGARKGKGKRAQRGALAENIVETLKSAGAKGMTVKDIADEVGSNYRNVAVWFVTTGKKNKAIKKIAPATYRLVG